MALSVISSTASSKDDRKPAWPTAWNHAENILIYSQPPRHVGKKRCYVKHRVNPVLDTALQLVMNNNFLIKQSVNSSSKRSKRRASLSCTGTNSSSAQFVPMSTGMQMGPRGRHNYFSPGRSAKYCEERVGMSVCLSTHTSQKSEVQTSQNFLYVLSGAIAWSSPDDNEYVMYFQFS